MISPFLRSKKNILSLFSSIILIFGVFGPWLWRGYNSYQVYNPTTGQTELHYRFLTYISPFYLSIISEGKEITINWFVNPGMTLSGLILIISSILFILIDNKLWIKGVFCLSAIIAYSFFFLNLGGGLWLGLFTKFDWGFGVTTLGIFLMIFSTLIKIIS